MQACAVTACFQAEIELDARHTVAKRAVAASEWSNSAQLVWRQ